MAAKKFYAVKNGRTTGIFTGWEECKESVSGYPGAEYKGFATLDEAKNYLGGTMLQEDIVLQAKHDAQRGSAGKGTSEEVANVSSDTLLTYVDGSFEESIGKYSFGCVFITPEHCIYGEYGNGDNEQSLQHRNVTGEMLGAMYAVKTAMMNGFQKVEIRYDYEGIEKWVTGAWRSKTELTQKYTQAMREWGRSIEIRFTKVAAHTNVYYNEKADKLAKAGLEKAHGVPKVRRFEEMRLLEEFDI